MRKVKPSTWGNSPPQLIDVNADGLLDLVIGEKNGSLMLFLNCGSLPLPLVHTDHSEFETSWGGIQVNNALGINGYSTPCLYQDGGDIHSGWQ